MAEAAGTSSLVDKAIRDAKLHQINDEHIATRPRLIVVRWRVWRWERWTWRLEEGAGRRSRVTCFGSFHRTERAARAEARDVLDGRFSGVLYR